MGSQSILSTLLTHLTSDSSPMMTAIISLVAIFLLVLVWTLTITLRDWYRLRHVPGPFWGGFSCLWATRRLWQPESSFTDLTRELDRKYGPVVRWGPRSVLFSDPAVIPVIYATTKVWRKAESYEPAMAIINGRLQDSFVTTRNEERVTQVKKHINAAFTPRAIVADYEPHVDATIRLLLDRVSGASEPSSPSPSSGAGDPQTHDVDLARWISLFAFEAICRIAFSDGDFTEADVAGTLVGVKERFDHWFYWFAAPGWERLLFKNPFVRGRLSPSLLVRRAVARVSERIGGGKDGGMSLNAHADLLNGYLKAQAKSPETFHTQDVVGMVLSIINAGAETTSSTMIETMRQLLLNPASLAAVRAELDSSIPSSSPSPSPSPSSSSFSDESYTPPPFSSVSHLRLLEAAVKEAMRLNPVNVAPMEREVPAPGATIAGVFVPGGTSVAINTSGLALREDVWGAEPAKFRPERWIEADAEQLSKMERAFSGFGHGKRICIGRHIAWLEMKKALAALVLQFDIKLLHPEKPMKYHKSIVQIPKELWVEVTPRGKRQA